MKTHHHQLCMALFAVTLLASTAPATISVYYNLNDYAKAGAETRHYCDYASHGLNPLPNGQTYWEYADDEYGFHAHADNGLWSNPGVLLTCNANDPLVFTFENSPEDVHSFGGYFASGDSQGNIIYQNLTLTATDSQNNIVQVTISGSEFVGGRQFIGFISGKNVLLKQVTLEGMDDPKDNYPQVYGIYVNSPEPTTVCLLGLGALGLLKKRRA